MTYEIYRYIFLGGAILTGIMFVVSVLVFFLLKIPTVIGDLTGANARKAIENIRSHNETTGEKTYRSSKVNRERGKLTDKISSSGRLIKDPSHSLHGAMGTEKISTQRLPSHDVAKETTVFSGSSETTVLENEHIGAAETTLLMNGAETTLLSNAGFAGAETTVLSQKEEMSETTVLNAPVSDSVFVIEYEITYIHTDELIA